MTIYVKYDKFIIMLITLFFLLIINKNGELIMYWNDCLREDILFEMKLNNLIQRRVSL